MFNLSKSVDGRGISVRSLTKIESKINSKMGRAINDHKLIRANDRILVAVSGGKDSYVLLTLLKKIQSWAPVKFDIVAAHITTDFRCSICTEKKDLSVLFQRLEIEYVFGHVNVLDEKGETTCFWCSWNKRKVLFEMAEKNRCNKIALGHHKDDIVETLLLNLFFKGEISSINPIQRLFNGKIELIRPLCYVEEDMIRSCAGEKGFSSKTCGCPFGETSKRKMVKDILAELQTKTPGTNLKTNIFNSVSRVRKDYMGFVK